MLAPRVTFLVHPPGHDPSVLHLLQVHPHPLIVLTLPTKLQPLLRALPGPMGTLAIRHHVLLWDASVVHTLPTQDHFQLCVSNCLRLPLLRMPSSNHVCAPAGSRQRYTVARHMHDRTRRCKPPPPQYCTPGYGICLTLNRARGVYYLGGYTPPPLYKLRPCPSYSRRRDRINCVRNFNYVRNVVRPHKTWVCRHICQLHGAMDTCNMPHARQAHSQEFEVVRAQTSP